ncbi:MAG: hypothetical protein NC078_03925 [Ruminococcus sp.]|nr:hypothetical protein [Ruminococcus sp.]
MTGRRYKLHEMLTEALGSGSVYYQPPESLKLKYPCIVYEMSGMKRVNADDSCYKADRSYKVTFISKNPDEETVDKLSKLPLCSFNRFYTADGLNHYVFVLYF